MATPFLIIVPIVLAIAGGTPPALAAASAPAAPAASAGNGNGNGALPETRIERAERESKTRTIFDDPLGGAVVNRTVTVIGHDFYQSFTTLWRQKDVSSHVSIAVYERPTARFGSEIWVIYRQKRMFQTFLPPARARARDISEQAVEIVYRNIANSEVERVMMRSPDLAPEEM
ncbi:MAG: curli production assembly/transport protein CsgE [Burkholderiaceae bacterium]